MKFHQWENLAKLIFTLPDKDEQMKILRAIYDDNQSLAWCVAAERNWMLEDSPFYLVYPVVAEGFLKTNLDNIRPSDVAGRIDTLPKELLVRFPVDSEPIIGGEKLEAILISRSVVEPFTKKPLIAIWCATDKSTYYIVWKNSPSKKSIVDCFPTINGLTKEELKITNAGVQVLITLSLIADQPELIEKVCAIDDTFSVALPKDPKRIEKMKKAGRLGFAIGRQVENIPHYRKAHFSIRWTGKGRTVPRWTPIKSAIVNRRKLVEVPTGYLEVPPTTAI